MKTATAAALIIAGAVLGRGLASEPSDVLASVEVPLDGSAAYLPEMTERADYKLRISGVLECDMDGREYDAAYRSDASGAFNQPHSLVSVEPRAATLEQAEVGRHHYTYRLPARGDFLGKRFSVRLDVARLAEDFGRPRSQVRASLRGELKAELLLVPRTLPPLVLAALVFGPIVIVAAAALWMLAAAVRATKGPEKNVAALMRRIERKGEAALQEARGAEGLLPQLNAQLPLLMDAVLPLAGIIASHRQKDLDDLEATTRADLRRLEKRSRHTRNEEDARECQQQISMHNHTLNAIAAYREQEPECLRLLGQVESEIDALRIALPEIRRWVAEPDAGAPPQIRRIEELSAHLKQSRGKLEETEPVILASLTSHR